MSFVSSYLKVNVIGYLSFPTVYFSLPVLHFRHSTQMNASTRRACMASTAISRPSRSSYSFRPRPDDSTGTGINQCIMLRYTYDKWIPVNFTIHSSQQEKIIKNRNSYLTNYMQCIYNDTLVTLIQE